MSGVSEEQNKERSSEFNQPERSDIAVNAYRIEQLEKQIEELRNSSETLNFEQIKQMFLWLGLPVVIATGVFGLALWQTILTGATGAAEVRASEAINARTAAIDSLQSRIQSQQERSETASIELQRVSAQAEVAARSAVRQADQVEARAIDAERALTQLRLATDTANEIQQAPQDVEEIAQRISENSDFQRIVSQSAFSGLTGLIAAFDQRSGCPVGWEQFEAAAGRVIIGVGQGEIDRPGDQDIPLTVRRWRDFGGAETHVLEIDEMPAHGHRVALEGADTRVDISGLNSGTNWGVRRTIGPGETSTAGGGRPHNNMPPYIALYYCEKK